MRISDWSSDVCSSDLSRAVCATLDCFAALAMTKYGKPLLFLRSVRRRIFGAMIHRAMIGGFRAALGGLDHQVEEDAFIIVVGEDERHRQLARAHRGAVDRSEEHTSELQSLMRI